MNNDLLMTANIIAFFFAVNIDSLLQPLSLALDYRINKINMILHQNYASSCIIFRLALIVGKYQYMISLVNIHNGSLDDQSSVDLRFFDRISY